MRPHQDGEPTDDAHPILVNVHVEKFLTPKAGIGGARNAARKHPRAPRKLGEKEVQPGRLLEIGAVPKLVDEPSHRVGMNP
jgi:hypothetical protein